MTKFKSPFNEPMVKKSNYGTVRNHYGAIFCNFGEYKRYTAAFLIVQLPVERFLFVLYIPGFEFM